MNRVRLQQLAEERLRDAECLLNGGRWSGAYYLAGYAVECGLKACIIAQVVATGGSAVFQEKKSSDKYFTHNLGGLLDLANLTPALDAAVLQNQNLGASWTTAKDWKESSRYELKTEVEARTMVQAVADNANGVFAWLRTHW